MNLDVGTPSLHDCVLLMNQGKGDNDNARASEKITFDAVHWPREKKIRGVRDGVKCFLCF